LVKVLKIPLNPPLSKGDFGSQILPKSSAPDTACYSFNRTSASEHVFPNTVTWPSVYIRKGTDNRPFVGSSLRLSLTSRRRKVLRPVRQNTSPEMPSSLRRGHFCEEHRTRSPWGDREPSRIPSSREGIPEDRT